MFAQVIGEIGAFDEDGNETVEIQRITKKRRVIVTKSAVRDGTPSIDEDDVKGEDTPYEETTTVTRRVVITKNEFDEDVETIFEEENLHKYEVIRDRLLPFSTFMYIKLLLKGLDFGNL